MNKTNEILVSLICLSIILQISFINAQYDWSSYGNSFSPLWQEQYTNSYGRFDAGITSITSLEGYNPISGRVQPLVSSLSSENTTLGEKMYVIFPTGNNVQIYDKNLLLIDEISAGGNIVNQFDITDFDRDGFTNDVVGIFNVSGDYKFKAFVYNFSTTLYELLNETELTANSSNIILGIRCQAGNCYYLNIYPYNETNYKANFTIINKTGIYESKLTLSGNDFNIPNANVGSYEEPLSWYDFDNDGKDEWIAWTDKFVLMFESDGTIDFNKFISNIRDVKPFHSQSGNNFWRIAVADLGTVKAYKIDGSTLWTSSSIHPDYEGAIITLSNLKLAITDDYDYDYSKYDNEIYVTNEYNAQNPSYPYQTYTRHIYIILKGYNGNPLIRVDSPQFGHSTLTIADMNHNGYKDFIHATQIYDPFTNSIIANIPSLVSNCVPADINIDGFLELICSNPDGSIIYSSTLENQNAYITSVIYNPSTIVQVNNSLIVTISATDIEGDTPLYYGIKCNSTANWTADQTSPIFSCYYGEVGTTTNTVRVRDQWHLTYDTFAQLINVTLTGAECNLNGVCEAGIGENYISCPADCPCNLNGVCEAGIGENYISCPADCPTPPPPAGYPEINLPTDIVNVDNINEGLLPTIYYGILGFFSYTLSPMIILIFVIFFVLIILTLGTIIKKIAQKVGS